MKKILSILCMVSLLFIIAEKVYAVGNIYGSSSGENFHKVGGTGSQFLKIDIGARANGMGAYSAVVDDLTSIFWNPAGIAEVKTISADFSYTQWIAGYSHNFFAVSMPLGEKFTTAVHVISFSSGDIPITTTDNDAGTGSTYRVSDLSLGVSVGGYLTDQFSFGVTGKFVQNGFGTISANGMAFDVGTKYETGIQGIKLGFSIHNLGAQLSYGGQDLNSNKKLYDALFSNPLDVSYISYPYSLPLIFRAGASSDIIKDETGKLIGAIDFITTSDSPEQFALGAEYLWNDLIAVRGGYRTGRDQFGLCGGVGLKYIGGGFKGTIDYSINPSKDLGLVNRISIIIAVGN